MIERHKELKRRRKRKKERGKLTRKGKRTVNHPKILVNVITAKDGAKPQQQYVESALARAPRDLIAQFPADEAPKKLCKSADEDVKKAAITRTQVQQFGEWTLAKETQDLLARLSGDEKPKKIWQSVDANAKNDIIRRAKILIDEKRFVGPAAWDGSIKQALSIMVSGKIPNGFRNFLETHGLKDV